MRQSFWISCGIHIIVFFITIFGVPNPFRHVIKDDGMMVVEFATIAPKTTAPLISDELPKEKPETLEPIKPLPKPEEIIKEEAKEVVEQKATQEEQKKQEEDNKEELKKTDHVKEQPPVTKDDDALLLEKQKEEKKKKEEDKKKKEDAEKKKQEDLKKKKQEEEKKKQDADKKKKKDGEKKALVNLDNKDKKDVKSDKKKDPNKKMKSMDDLLNDIGDKSNKKKGASGAPAEEIGETFTASEIAKLRTHISKCWNVHAGAKGAKDHVVDIEIHLNQDGYVEKADILDKEKMKSDPFYRVAAETAQRSLLDPDCNPLPIPKSDYEKWKEITFRFDPKDM